MVINDCIRSGLVTVNYGAVNDADRGNCFRLGAFHSSKNLKIAFSNTFVVKQRYAIARQFLISYFGPFCELESLLK